VEAEEGYSLAASRPQKHRRVLLKERTEAGQENEFRVNSTGIFCPTSPISRFTHLTTFLFLHVIGNKLNLDDLLVPLSSSSSTLQTLKASTKALKPSTSSKSKPLAAPLPQRAQERLDRQAAYEQTKQEVDKWSETMKRIRDVCVFLS
jgi:U3 small nucleolar RNA-associated protein 14